MATGIRLLAAEAMLFDKTVRASKREDLRKQLSADFAPLLKAQLRLLEEKITTSEWAGKFALYKFVHITRASDSYRLYKEARECCIAAERFMCCP